MNWQSGAWFPRTRGDRPAATKFTSDVLTVPPHARDRPDGTIVARCYSRVSPARARIDPSASPHNSERERFPRTCGDRPIPAVNSSCAT